MADIIKINRNKGFTVVSNHHIFNKNLSFKAKGLLTMMLATPPNWKSSIAGYAAMSKDGRDSVNTAIKELEKAGYIIRRRLHDAKGHFVGYEYTINEIPVLPPEKEDKEDEENVPSTVYGKSVNGETVNGETADGETVNGKSTANKYLNKANTKETNAQGGESRFDEFWKSYPRKVKKPVAKKAFEKLKADEALFNSVMRGLEHWKASPQWQKDGGQFIPYPASWLNGRCWEDDVPSSFGSAPAPASDAGTFVPSGYELFTDENGVQQYRAVGG